MRTLALCSIPLILFGIAPSARSASVTLLSDPRDVVLVNGVIETADVAKIDGILSSLKGTPALWINSDGGDLEAAIAIGRLLRKTEAVVTVQGRCASACVFILAGGVTRSAMQGVVVIHRPFLTKDLPGGTGYDESYKRAAQMIRSYLAEMNIPAELGDRMLTIPPDEGVTLTKEELDRYTLLIAQDPAYEQKLAANEAHRWGISLTEQRRRQAIQKTICIANTPKHNDDDVEFNANWYCNDAVMSGGAPSGIQTRLTWVMANRSAIARLPQKARWECVKEMIFGSSKDCFNHPLEFTPAPAPASQADVEQGAQALDAKFQQMPMWIVVKREFPVWYSEQLKQAATLLAQKQPQVAINKHLVEALVALRRQHAQEALLARTDKLKAVASAFLDNLKSLSKRGAACYAFISQGETASRGTGNNAVPRRRDRAGAGRRHLRRHRRWPQDADPA